jgi:tRNA (guanine37-N1)-methyltransferase
LKNKNIISQIPIKIRNVNPVSKKEEIFNTILTRYKVEEKNKLSDFLKENLCKLGIQVSVDEYTITEEEISLNYDNFTYIDVLRKVLPLDEIPNSYELIGKIAHLNLREKFLPYKNIIGQLILDVQKN